MNKNSTVTNQFETTVDSFVYSEAEFIELPHGWRAYSPIDVAKNGGSLITSGSFSQVQVWMTPTEVAFSTVDKVTVPGPDPATPINPSFSYPAAPEFDIVILQNLSGIPKKEENSQVRYTPMDATATSEKSCQTIQLNREVKNLFIAFNDLVGAYGDYSGEVKIMVKLIQ